MPPLKNIAHEKFAHAVISAPTITDAYKQVYDAGTNRILERSATEQGSKLLSTNNNVKERVYELLSSRGLSSEKIVDRFREFVDDRDNPAQSWDATKTGLKIYGLIDDDKQQNINNIEIKIVRLT